MQKQNENEECALLRFEQELRSQHYTRSIHLAIDFIFVMGEAIFFDHGALFHYQ